MKGLYENVTSAVHPEDTVTELDYWIILEKWIMKNMSAAPACLFFFFFSFSFSFSSMLCTQTDRGNSVTELD